MSPVSRVGTTTVNSIVQIFKAIAPNHEHFYLPSLVGQTRSMKAASPQRLTFSHRQTPSSLRSQIDGRRSRWSSSNILFEYLMKRKQPKLRTLCLVISVM